MTRYRILLTVEERNGEANGEELLDFTQTVGWTDDIDAAADYTQNILAQLESGQGMAGVTWNDPNWWTDEEFDRIRDKNTAVCPICGCTAYPHSEGYECADCGYVLQVKGRETLE